MFHQVPPPCLVVRAHEQDGLSPRATPEYTRPCQAQGDDAAHGTCEGATPKRPLQGQQLRLGHATLRLYHVVLRRAARPAVTPAADPPHRRHALLPLALQPPGALWGTPPRAGGRPPGFAQG